MGDIKEELVPTTELAELFGMTEKRVQQLAKEGIIPTVKKRPYMFHLWDAASAYIQHLREKIQGREEKSSKTVQAEKLRAETDLKRAKADIETLKLRELEGKMHSSEDVEAVTNDLVFTIRSMVMSLPGRLAMDVIKARDANEASVIIRSECYKILRELADYQYDPEAYKQRTRDRNGWGEEQEGADDDG